MAGAGHSWGEEVSALQMLVVIRQGLQKILGHLLFKYMLK